MNEIPNEWLYDEPKFFKLHQDVSSNSIIKFCEENEKNHYGAVIDDAMLSLQDQNGHEAFKDDIAGYIIDVPRNKGLCTKTSTFHLQEITKSESFGLCIAERRTPAISKKRFLHFYPLNQNVALACFLASSEREAIASFFDRHASYDQYFSETTAMASNKWATELHLSFYQITEKRPLTGKYQTIAKMEGFPFIRGSVREGNAMWINRATMSFRFDGDIFDRYWTCHFVEYNPQKIAEATMNRYKRGEIPHSITRKRIDGALKENAWRQRKILELVLFDMTLEDILRSTKEILKEAELCIERSFKQEMFNIPEHEMSKSVILEPLKLWNELEPTLQLIEKSLNENLAIVTLWIDRDKERRRDEPRWTLKDESNYRDAISALQALNRHKVHELERCSANIIFFHKAFARKMQFVQNMLDQRGADDIRLFTYVTVVFLPVGFATSVFSMSGAPSEDTLHGMIITAIIALLATLLALVNARILDRVLGPIFGACRVVTEAIVSPLIGILHRFIQPAYLLLCQSVYYIAFRCYTSLYMQPISPHDLLRNDQYPEKYDQGAENYERAAEKHVRDVYDKKQKHYKRIIELGPIRTAQRDAANIQAEQKAKEQKEVRNVSRDIRDRREKEYMTEEEKSFRENGLTELQERFCTDMTQVLEKELKNAVEAELEAVRKYRGEISAIEEKRLEDQLIEDLRPPMKERLVKEGKRRIRRQTDIIIKNRVEQRIEKETTQYIERQRIQSKEKRRIEEEERKKQNMKPKKAGSGIIRCIVGKANQTVTKKSAYGEIEEQILRVA